MIEAVCHHCNKLSKCLEIGAWNLCLEHSELKQYQEKKKKDYSIKRVPIKHTYKPIPKISKKHNKKLRDYSIISKKFKEDNPICQANITGCTFDATEVHHMKGRTGALLTDVKYFISLCHNCHTYIELNPLEAKAKGWSFDRLSE
jgi:hypothetical protein